MIGLLLLIPILCISFSLYIVSLIDFVLANNLDILMVSLTAFINIIVSFFVIKIFIRDNEHIAFIMNLDKLSSLIHGYFSFIIMFLFGLSLVINSFLFKINVNNLTIGTIIIGVFIYITIEHVLMSKEYILKLVDIDDSESNVNRLIFESNNEEEFEHYVSKKEKYKVNSKYLCKVGKSSKCIKKIIKEVIELD